MTSGLRLGEVEPRERAGSQTGRKYEYQYERTARASLDLLVDEFKRVCVYCDWHDDFVVEVGDSPTRYIFNQVKGRNLSEGPWTFCQFFGVRRKESRRKSKKPSPVDPTAIIPRMVLHFKNFGDNCAGLAFVTNAGLHPDLSKFLVDVSTASSIETLPEDARIAFEHTADAYVAADPQLALSPTGLFDSIRTLAVYPGQGQLEPPDAALLELADIVVQFSEIELLQRQAKQIARELVSRVRGKVGCTTTVVPTVDEQLRRDKGIVVADLLEVLSLSSDAYEQLKAGAGSGTVKTLSRLQRFCTKRGFDGSLLLICGFKAQWDVWRTTERHFLSSADYLLLESKARDVLLANLTIPKVIEEATDISKQFAGRTATSLTTEHVLGLIFSLAAQAEALGDVKGGRQ
jgi:hypothetical protein